jgi:hypothetical protein
MSAPQSDQHRDSFTKETIYPNLKRPVDCVRHSLSLVDRDTNGSTFAPTVPNKLPPPANALEGMVWISGGEFSMGCSLPSEGVCTMATMLETRGKGDNDTGDKTSDFAAC